VKINLAAYSTILQEKLKKATKLLRFELVPPPPRTRHLPNTSQDGYRYCYLLPEIGWRSVGTAVQRATADYVFVCLVTVECYYFLRCSSFLHYSMCVCVCVISWHQVTIYYPPPINTEQRIAPSKLKSASCFQTRLSYSASKLHKRTATQRVALIVFIFAIHHPLTYYVVVLRKFKKNIYIFVISCTRITVWRWQISRIFFSVSSIIMFNS